MSPRLIDWWRRRRLTVPRVNEVRWYESQQEVPEDLPRHELAVVGSRVKPKWLLLECPCGAGHLLQVNLSPRHAPHWRLADTDDQPSLYPSVDRDTPERRCHFWLREGRVRWTPDAFWGRRGAIRRR